MQSIMRLGAFYLIIPASTLVAGWGLDDGCYTTDPGETHELPTPRPCPSLTQGAGNRTKNTLHTRDLADLADLFPMTDPLREILWNATECYDEVDLSGDCGSQHIFEDDCALFGPGTYAFKICYGAEAFAMKCRVEAYHQYNYRVVGLDGFEQSSCQGMRCPQTDNCGRPGAGDILFSTAAQPDVVMVLHTKHKITYPRQLRDRLEREGFITYPVPGWDVAETWCNAQTIMAISKASVDRGKVSLVDHQGGRHDMSPSQKTLRTVQRILEEEYPSVEIGLSVGLPAIVFTLLGVCMCWPKLRKTRVPSWKREQPNEEDGYAGTGPGLRMGNMRRAENEQPHSHAADRPPPYE